MAAWVRDREYTWILSPSPVEGGPTEPFVVGVNLMYLRPDRVGGSEIYVRELVRALAERGTELRLFCNALAAQTFEPRHAVQIVQVSEGGVSTPGRLRDENWTLRRRLSESPVNVLFSPANFAAVALPHSVPQVVTVHDLQHIRLRENFSTIERASRSLLFRLTFARCRRVIAVSRATERDLLSNFRLPPNKVVTVLEGVAQGLKQSPETVATAQRENGIERPYLFYPAMMAPHKNHRFLIEAFAEIAQTDLSGVDLIFTGKSTGYESELRDHASALGLADRVRYLGYLDRDQLLGIMSGALAVVYPSLFEGFGLPVLEAMSCDVPVIASSTSSVPEVAGDGALLLDPRDRPSWVEALARICRDADLRSALAARGRAQARQFSWERCAEETVGVLKQAAEGSHES